jgi:8-amino-7-oxononanoate synthase
MEKESFFLEKGLLLKAIRPPSIPKGTSRFRVILRSGHTKEDLDFLFSYLN